jgi:Tetracyclin repressor-like, C-terminal domain
VIGDGAARFSASSIDASAARAAPVAIARQRGDVTRLGDHLGPVVHPEGQPAAYVVLEERRIQQARRLRGALRRRASWRRMCLYGMLAAEYQTLPRPIRDAVIAFFDENESWLERVLEQGRDSSRLSFDGSPRETAWMIINGLEGAMLVARRYGDRDRFRTASDRVLGTLAATS